jgi:hypothetical protein
VPKTGDFLEDNAENFKCIIYNVNSQDMQFVPFTALTLTDAEEKEDASLSIDWDIAHSTARKFFSNPSYKEFLFPDMREDCQIIKVLDPKLSEGKIPPIPESNT